MERSRQAEERQDISGRYGKGLMWERSGQVDLSTKPDAVLFFIRTFGVKKGGVLLRVATLWLPKRIILFVNQTI